VVCSALIALALASRLAHAEGGASGSAAAVDPLDAETQTLAPGFWDPLEPVNRRTLRMNGVLDRWFFDPVTSAYAFVVPGPARLAVRRFLVNLNSPVVFANDILQLAPVDAAVTVTRFVVNSTLGIGGLFDPATKFGLQGHAADFGETLALCGVPSGPYLILPALGPTTARDGTGYLVDLLFQPMTYLLTPAPTLIIYTSIQQGSVGLAAKDAHAVELQALEASSIDFYATLRSAYYQDRMAAIQARGDRGPVALARRTLRALSLAPSCSEIADLPSHAGHQCVEAVALKN
jgi:phospholipid-binding lipoprotein MlaA